MEADSSNRCRLSNEKLCADSKLEETFVKMYCLLNSRRKLIVRRHPQLVTQSLVEFVFFLISTTGVIKLVAVIVRFFPFNTVAQAAAKTHNYAKLSQN